MQIHINKNGQQLGPFEEAKVLEMLQNGELSANDLGIRRGEQQWEQLSVMFPQTRASVSSPIAENMPQTKKTGKGCFSIPFLAFGLLLLAISLTVAIRNSNYSDSACYGSLSYEREAAKKAEAENTNPYGDKEEARKKMLSARSRLGDAERKCVAESTNAKTWKIAGVVGSILSFILTLAGLIGIAIGRSKKTN